MEVVDRRQFLQFSSGLAVLSGPGIRLKAFAAAEMPLQMDAPGCVAGRIVELRSYETAPDQAALAAAGIVPSVYQFEGSNVTYLIPFESIEERNASWARFASHQEFCSNVTRIALFTVVDAN